MTSQIKVQGSVKGLAIAALAAFAAMASMSAEAARPAPRTGAGIPMVRPPLRLTPPPAVVVIPPCKRGGPGITPC